MRLTLESRPSDWPIDVQPDAGLLRDKVVAQWLQKDLSLERKGGSLRKVLKARLRKSSIEKDRTGLLAVRPATQTEILGDMWMQDQAKVPEQRHPLKGLDMQLQKFIINIAAGHTRFEDLIWREAPVTRSQAGKGGSKKREHVPKSSDC